MKLTGTGASEGIVVGPAFVPATGRPEPERTSIEEDQVAAELQRFEDAVETVAAQISETVDGLRASGNEDEAGIFEFHAEMAEDPELASADDVRDVTGQIAGQLIGRTTAALEALETPSVVLAQSLAPSDTARIPKGLALAFVTAEGSRTSHVSIMARSMGIPAVVGVGPALEEVMGAKTVAVDGGEGYAISNPDAETVAEFERKSGSLAEERAALDEYRHIEAGTSEGRRIEVAANLGSASEAED